MIKLIVPAFLILALVINATAVNSQAAEPTEQLKPILEELFSILDDQSLQGDEQKEVRRQRIMAAISSGFDFREMSRRVLGSTWNDISAEQRDHFVVQMTKLLENVYIGRLESYDGREVEFAAERIKGKRAQVTTLINYEDSKIPVHYIMQKEHDRWMVYDINIEGVSLIRNYMEQFRTILRQEEYEGLIQIIEKKNQLFAEGKEGN
jgi:phospholipid transport system substrate-binding protein